MPKAAIGMKLKYESTPGSGVFDVTLQRVSSISGPTNETTVQDVTAHDNADPYREKFPTLRSYGKSTFKVFYEPQNSTHDAISGLKAKWRNSTIQAWRLETPDGLYYEDCDGFISSLNQNFNVDNVMEMNVTLDYTGTPSYSTD